MQGSRTCAAPEPKGHDAGSQADATVSDGLQSLRECFDAQLASLNEPGAGDRLARVMETPCKLNGKVIAGETY